MRHVKVPSIMSGSSAGPKNIEILPIDDDDVLVENHTQCIFDEAFKSGTASHIETKDKHFDMPVMTPSAASFVESGERKFEIPVPSEVVSRKNKSPNKTRRGRTERRNILNTTQVT